MATGLEWLYRGSGCIVEPRGAVGKEAGDSRAGTHLRRVNKGTAVQLGNQHLVHFVHRIDQKVKYTS